jgi:hypothetical protein
MSTIEKIERVIIEDGVQLCYCTLEKIYKPCTEFNTRNSESNGFQYYCKECCKITRGDDYNPRIRPNESKLSKLILESIGYNTSSEITIHQQFIKKHSL